MKLITSLNSLTFLAPIARLAFVPASPTGTGLAADPGCAPLKPGATVSWEPADAYCSRKKMKARWQLVCDEAFTREGCDGGTIHKGENQVFKPNGKMTVFVNAEAAPSMKLGMENGKKMRIFWDGSSQEGWSARDYERIKTHKRSRKPPQPWQGPKALISWDPVDSYDAQMDKRFYWEQRCHQALTRAGCEMERRLLMSGWKGRRLWARPDLGTAYGKKMRVFRVGSFEDMTEGGWSKCDKKSMGKAKRQMITNFKATHGPGRGAGEYQY